MSPHSDPDRHRDRLTDLALWELVGGQSPPDHSAEIVAKMKETPSGEQTELARAPDRLGTWRRLLLYAGSAAAILIAGVLIGWTLRSADSLTAQDEDTIALTAESPEGSARTASATQVERPDGADEHGSGASPTATFDGERGWEQQSIESSGGEATVDFAPDSGSTVQNGVATSPGPQLDALYDLEFSAPAAGEPSGPQSGHVADSKTLPATPDGTLGDSLRPADKSSGAVDDLLGRSDAIVSSPVAESADGLGSIPARPETRTLPLSPTGGKAVTDVDGAQQAGSAGGYGAAAGGGYGIGGGGYGAATESETLASNKGRFEVHYSESESALGTQLYKSARPSSADRYVEVVEQPFIKTLGQQALSTVSIDVDSASYANVRRFLLTDHQLPPPAAVRIEELVNYFSYRYPTPTDNRPFAVKVDVAGCPWQPQQRLVRVALKGREISTEQRPAANLVFLVDVSGSMSSSDKLPLVVEALKQLTLDLRVDDRVAVVVYASQQGLALPSTPGSERTRILAALDRLSAGGSTAGGAGIQLAYQIARENFQSEGINRVILCTDGDFNVGVTDTEALQTLVAEEAQSGTYLTVLGFGRGNLNDQMLEAITNRGNGNYFYVDHLTEARRVLIEQMSGTLVTIAKDVKLQVEFNPLQVASYRLVGYDNRIMAAEDFADDRRDAGEIGAGHTVTYLYQVQPTGVLSGGQPLRYQATATVQEGDERSGLDQELLAVKLRYKLPEANESTLMTIPVIDRGTSFERSDSDFQFASSVAAFGLLLKQSPYRGQVTWSQVHEWAWGSRGDDPQGLRTQFIEMISKAAELSGSSLPGR